MNFFKQDLPENEDGKTTLIALDRGYTTVIQWLLEAGFEIIHTQQRAPDFAFTWGKVGLNKLGNRVIIEENGEMGVYWATKTIPVQRQAPGARRPITVKIKVITMAMRSGTGKVILMLTTKEEVLGPCHRVQEGVETSLRPRFARLLRAPDIRCCSCCSIFQFRQ